MNIISTKVLAQQKRRSVPDCFRKLPPSAGLRKASAVNFGPSITNLARPSRPRPLSQVNFRNIYQPKVKLRGRSVDFAPPRNPGRGREAPALTPSFKACLGRRSTSSFAKCGAQPSNDRTRGAGPLSRSWNKPVRLPRRKPLGTRKTDFLNKDLALGSRAKLGLKQHPLPPRSRSQAPKPVP